MPSTRHLQTCLLAAALAACALPAQAAFSASHSVALTYLFPNLDTPYQGMAPVTVTGPTDSVTGFAGSMAIKYEQAPLRHCHLHLCGFSYNTGSDRRQFRHEQFNAVLS